jgi:hypothetical protein
MINLNSIWSRLKKLRPTEIMAIAIVVLVIFLMQQCNSNSNLKQDSRISKQNELALIDSVRSVKNRWGEEIYLKNVFVANEKELKRLNAELAEDLKRAKGKVVYIQNTKTVIEHDTLFLTNTITQFSDGTTRLSWTHDTIYDAYNSRSLAGFSEFIMDSVGVTDKGTQITKDQIRIRTRNLQFLRQGIEITANLLEVRGGHMNDRLKRNVRELNVLHIGIKQLHHPCVRRALLCILRTNTELVRITSRKKEG